MSYTLGQGSIEPFLQTTPVQFLHGSRWIMESQVTEVLSVEPKGNFQFLLNLDECDFRITVSCFHHKPYKRFDRPASKSVAKA